MGANASAPSHVDAFINQALTEAESFINSVTGVNYSDSYSTLNVDVQGILKRWASALAAIDVLNYDPSGMPQRQYETRIDVLDDEARKCQSELKEKKGSDFVTGA